VWEELEEILEVGGGGWGLEALHCFALLRKRGIHTRSSCYLSEAYTRSQRARTVAAIPKAGPFTTPEPQAASLLAVTLNGQVDFMDRAY
jgi:hypothetical protein